MVERQSEWSGTNPFEPNQNCYHKLYIDWIPTKAPNVFTKLNRIEIESTPLVGHLYTKGGHGFCHQCRQQTSLLTLWPASWVSLNVENAKRHNDRSIKLILLVRLYQLTEYLALSTWVKHLSSTNSSAVCRNWSRNAMAPKSRTFFSSSRHSRTFTSAWSVNYDRIMARAPKVTPNFFDDASLSYRDPKVAHGRRSRLSSSSTWYSYAIWTQITYWKHTTNWRRCSSKFCCPREEFWTHSVPGRGFYSCLWAWKLTRPYR